MWEANQIIQDLTRGRARCRYVLSKDEQAVTDAYDPMSLQPLVNISTYILIRLGQLGTKFIHGAPAGYNLAFIDSIMDLALV